ncbi:proline racemase family protein [Virgibacillus sp. CBA3643]|uniref:proline racemase family protein n=1 Tax=Virgibacillus sp. CBA3643 TaxID=2942278 RepID=UPI0035A2E4B3
MNIEKMFSTIDTHVAGEAFRIIIQSSIDLNEDNVKSNHQLLQNFYQDEKDFLLNEPRGHRGMNGCIIISSKVADYGLLFFNHDQEAQFKYGGLVTSVTALIETGNLNVKENGIYKIETIQGIHEVRVNFENQEVSKVLIESNECKVLENNGEYQLVEVDESRNYVIFPLPDSIPNIDLDHLAFINKWGRKTVDRFTDENIPFDGIVITQSSGAAGNEICSVTFEKDGSITRSPGMDSTFAIFTALKKISNENNQLTNYSIFDSSITANYLPGTLNRFSVEIQGFTTGMHQFIFDKKDPLKNGFLLK